MDSIFVVSTADSSTVELPTGPRKFGRRPVEVTGDDVIHMKRAMHHGHGTRIATPEDFAYAKKLDDDAAAAKKKADDDAAAKKKADADAKAKSDAEAKGKPDQNGGK